MPKHFKPSIGDFIATEMQKVMHSEEHQRLYKTAVKAKKDDDKKADKKADPKAKKNEKKAPKCKHPKGCTCEKKAEKCDKKCKACKELSKKAYVQAAIDGFIRVSTVLDELELSKSASMTLQTLETLIAEAEDVFYTKDKKDDDDDDDDKEEDKKDDDKDEDKDEKKDKGEDKKDKKDDDKNDCGEGMMAEDMNKADEEIAIELDDESFEEPHDTDITELDPEFEAGKDFDFPEDEEDDDETIREILSDPEMASLFDDPESDEDEDEAYV